MSERSIWEAQGITLSTVAYGVPVDPWEPLNPFEPSVIQPIEPIQFPSISIQQSQPTDTADSLLDRCKARLADIKRIKEQYKELIEKCEIEAEILQKMISATERSE